MPKEGDKWLTYKDVGKQHQVHYVGYADFEAFGEPIKDWPIQQNNIHQQKS